eukprot:5127239-Pyramimonas_sp.AAC.1
MVNLPAPPELACVVKRLRVPSVVMKGYADAPAPSGEPAYTSRTSSWASDGRSRFGDAVRTL